MAKMKWSQFKKGLDLALKVNTTYAFGGFGWQLNSAYKKRLLDNKRNANDKTIRDGINKGNDNTFAFDCVCLPKGILWGWNANNKVSYGGAVYKANGVPDVNADQMMTSAHVTGLSTNFSKIKVGAFVGMKGHMGIYVGNGEVVECTPKWGAKVLKSKLSERKWVNWGMSKYIDYSELDNKPTFKPYDLELGRGTKLYNDSFKEYSLPIHNERTVKIVEEKQGYGKFNDASLKGTNHAWVKLNDVNKPENKPSFKPYKMYLTKGTPLYDDKFKEYAIPIQVPRDVTIVDEKSGYGRFNDKGLKGTDHAWVKLGANTTDIKAGTMVKINKGAKYQGSAKGKPVSAYAYSKAWKVLEIKGNIAKLDNINSWLAIKDLVKVN